MDATYHSERGKYPYTTYLTPTAVVLVLLVGIPTTLEVEAGSSEEDFAVLDSLLQTSELLFLLLELLTSPTRW